MGAIPLSLSLFLNIIINIINNRPIIYNWPIRGIGSDSPLENSVIKK